MIYIWAFAISLVLSSYLSCISIKAGQKFHILSKPKKKETDSKSCLGGLCIYLAFVAASLSAYLLKSVSISGIFSGIITSSGLIILLGLVDDIIELRPTVKIVAELIAAWFLIMAGISIKIIFLPIWVNIVITLLWLLFITNAFNLLDIADGLTSGLVIIISSTLLIISLVNKDFFSSILLCALTGAHLGFLKYNYPPARLYMGDTGSLFSGFLLAVIAMNISYAPLERPVALLAPLLIMGLPIYDTMFLIIMRAKKRKPVFMKTNDHFVLRLVYLGYSIRKSLWMMYIFSIFLGISALIVAFGSNIIGIVTIIVVFLVAIFTGKKIGTVKVEG